MNENPTVLFQLIRMDEIMRISPRDMRLPRHSPCFYKSINVPVVDGSKEAKAAVFLSVLDSTLGLNFHVEINGRIIFYANINTELMSGITHFLLDTPHTTREEYVAGSSVRVAFLEIANAETGSKSHRHTKIAAGNAHNTPLSSTTRCYMFSAKKLQHEYGFNKHKVPVPWKDEMSLSPSNCKLPNACHGDEYIHVILSTDPDAAKNHAIDEMSGRVDAASTVMKVRREHMLDYFQQIERDQIRCSAKSSVTGHRSVKCIVDGIVIPNVYKYLCQFALLCDFVKKTKATTSAAKNISCVSIIRGTSDKAMRVKHMFGCTLNEAAAAGNLSDALETFDRESMYMRCRRVINMFYACYMKDDHSYNDTENPMSNITLDHLASIYETWYHAMLRSLSLVRCGIDKFTKIHEHSNTLESILVRYSLLAHSIDCGCGYDDVHGGNCT